MTGKELGGLGEAAVCRYLEDRGWTILERNYTVRGGEIDIIASSQKHLAFVEVKTRKTGAMVRGLGAVTKTKQTRIIRTALHYLRKNRCSLQPRFDAAEVDYDGVKIVRLRYIERAFDASGCGVSIQY